jgi:two-component system response regulator FixJ
MERSMTASTYSIEVAAFELPRSRQLYVVDDDVMFRDSIVFLLESSGFSVAANMTPRDFLSRLPQLDPGTVLVDLRMPDIDGFDLIRMLGDRIAAFPVIVITGHGDMASAVRATHLGAVDFLEKPVTIADLVESINAVVALQFGAGSFCIQSATTMATPVHGAGKGQ